MDTSDETLIDPAADAAERPDETVTEDNAEQDTDTAQRPDAG